MDGLDIKVVNYLNSFANYEVNKEIIAEFRRMMDDDPETKKRYRKWYDDPLNKGENAEAVFPFEGAWYICHNGSVREEEPLRVFGPSTTAEIFHIIRMERHLEEMDPSYYHEIDYAVIQQRVWRMLDGDDSYYRSWREKPDFSLVSPLPLPEEPEQNFTEDEFAPGGEGEVDPIFTLGFFGKKLEEMARDFFADEMSLLQTSTGDPAEKRREAMRRLLRMMEMTRPPLAARARPGETLYYDRPAVERVQADGRSARALARDYIRERISGYRFQDDPDAIRYRLCLERQQEADWNREAKTCGVRTRKADAIFYSSGQVEPPLTWEYVASSGEVIGKEQVMAIREGVRAFYMRDPYGVRGVYRLYWILL